MYSLKSKYFTLVSLIHDSDHTKVSTYTKYYTNYSNTGRCHDPNMFVPSGVYVALYERDGMFLGMLFCWATNGCLRDFENIFYTLFFEPFFQNRRNDSSLLKWNYRYGSYEKWHCVETIVWAPRIYTFRHRQAQGKTSRFLQFKCSFLFFAFIATYKGGKTWTVMDRNIYAWAG